MGVIQLQTKPGPATNIYVKHGPKTNSQCILNGIERRHGISTINRDAKDQKLHVNYREMLGTRWVTMK